MIALSQQLLVVVSASTIIAVRITGATVRYARRRQILDVPNHRGSHSVPTPRGGGIAIVAVMGAMLAGLVGQGTLAPRVGLGLAIAALMVAGAGAWDDLRNVSVRIRLAIQLAAAALFVWTLLPSATTATAWSAPLTIIVAATAALAMVWLTNLYNFMDGIDGIAGITAVAFGIAATVLFVTAGAAPFALLTCALAAATLGFLRYNWPPAQIFMGDVGSGFLGFIAASFVLIALAQNIALGVAVLLPLLPFIVDTTLTLARRARRGQQIAHAHREHLYQRLNQRGYSHKQVSATFGTASALLGAWAIACQRGELSPLATLGPALIATLAAYGVGERASKR